MQTLDIDDNPDNGIQITPEIDENAKSIALDFNIATFDTEFGNLTPQLFQGYSSSPELVSSEQAIEHASKSERLSSIQEFSLYKAIANELNYGSELYNSVALKNSQQKRIYLWIWENILSNEFDMANDLAGKKIDDLEKDHDWVKKYLDYADTVISLSSLAASRHEIIQKAGTETFTHSFTQLTSLDLSVNNF